MLILHVSVEVLTVKCLQASPAYTKKKITKKHLNLGGNAQCPVLGQYTNKQMPLPVMINKCACTSPREIKCQTEDRGLGFKGFQDKQFPY